MSAPSGPAPANKPVDLIHRGVKKPSPTGTLTFVGLRPFSPMLQAALLRQPDGWGTRLLAAAGLAVVPAAQDPLPLAHLLLVVMSAAEVVKHTWWLTQVSYEYFPVSAALFVAGYNTVMDSANSLLFLWATTSALSPLAVAGINLNPVVPVVDLPLSMVVGSALFAAGMVLEVVAEAQRRTFKDDPKNRGILCRSGVWSVCRHPNYGGYALWRAGYAAAAGGWIAGAFIGAFQAVDFLTRGVPALENYCAERYGEQWKKYEKDVGYVLVPWVY